MSYKPFKPNRGEYYSNFDEKKEPKYEIQRMKLFGFRSGIAWKMIPALFYYCLMLLIIVSSIMGEIREFQFEAVDVILCFLKYLFIVVIAFSPAIFLSDFKYREKLPLFKKKTIAYNAAGMMVVILFSVVMIWVYQYCMSDTYKQSADSYYQKMQERYEEQTTTPQE